MARKTKIRVRPSPQEFFYANAGYSYGAGETPEQGRARCADNLAKAERAGSDAGLSFQWEYDDQTDESFRKTRNPYRLWVCICRNADGDIVASCGGIDLGRDGSPWSDPYRRVMEAELAQEALA